MTDNELITIIGAVNSSCKRNPPHYTQQEIKQMNEILEKYNYRSSVYEALELK